MTQMSYIVEEYFLYMQIEDMDYYESFFLLGKGTYI
jgi:hypothetical protein